MEYEVRAINYPNWVEATGFYGEYGKQKAQNLIDDGYFHQHLYEENKDVIFVVVERNKSC